MIDKPTPKGYKEEDYPPVPTGLNKFFRTFWPWQMIRFVVLNLKVMKIVIGGHS
ncbi:MAG: hypothetical protein LCH54_10125 [Bacteroidetes bacterium]|nr:hypothetical protein [Bacteroidota bacterium]MCA0446572.1 hypothetical protein [Bacteroidota bacterium]